ncbi:MAG: class I SAM-dependent methyltransferase [Gemmatimonadaceae bacterium]
MNDRRERWAQRYASAEVTRGEPSPFVLAHALTIPADAVIVDIAGGRGRHAVPLAARGRAVIILDYVERAVRLARWDEPRVHGVIGDATALPLRPGTAGGVICADYLDRTGLPELMRLLRPGGLLIIETFTTDHRALVDTGRALGPRRSDFLLQPRELPQLVAPLHVVDSYEGRVVDQRGERWSAGIVAVNETPFRDGASVERPVASPGTDS